jgi:hypothetical protein
MIVCSHSRVFHVAVLRLMQLQKDALMFAAAEGSTSALVALLETGADPYASDTVR